MKNHRTFANIPENIEAMKKVITQYEGAIKHKVCAREYRLHIAEEGRCPLCDTASYSCRSCPWMVILGDTCSSKHIYWSENVKEQKNRIRQLKRWIKIYEKEL